MSEVHDERNCNPLFIATLIAVFAFFFNVAPIGAQTVSGLISRIGETTHFELRGRKEWGLVTPKKEKDKITVTLPSLDEPTLVRLQSWNCPLVKEVKVNKNAPDGQYEVVFYLTSSEVESFDYLTDDPAYLIFDFYKLAPKEVAQPDAKEAPANKTSATRKAAKTKLAQELKSDKKDDYRKIERSPAGSETLSATQPSDAVQNAGLTADDLTKANIQFERGVFDGADTNYDRFKIKDYQIRDEAIMMSKQNIYIRFPMLAQKSNSFSEMMKTTPLYEIKPDETDENKEARFILKLFEKDRTGALFETIKYFEAKYPKSKYDEIIQNVKAEAYIRLYEKGRDPKDYEEFKSLYTYIIETYPDSVLTERNSLLVAYAGLEKNDGAETLRNLLKYLQKYPNSQERDRTRMGLAEAYVLLKKPEDAIKTYEDIIKNPLDKNYGVEAAYRIGDVYFWQRDYAKALKTYKDVQEKYPAYKNIFANAQYNKSESLFWLGRYKESLNEYIEFLRSFPSHQHGGFALTRIGELSEILGADQRQVLGAYIESYFRFPNSQGSEIARIRMLSQGLKSMKDREKKHAMSEIDDIAKKSQLPQMQEFTTLMKADGLSRRAEYRDSLDLLVNYYRNSPASSNLQAFKTRILRNISDVLKEETENKNYIEALNFYGKYSTTWLKNSDRIDTLYYQALAFERAGIIKEAKKSYVKILRDLKSISGQSEEKERLVYEHLPKVSQLQLRLAAVALEEKQYQESFKYLSTINEKLSPSEEVEKVQIGAVVSEQMGDTKRAIGYLEKLISGFQNEEKLLVPAFLDLVRLHLKENQMVDADRNLTRLEKMNEGGTNLTDEEKAKALELRGDLQLKNGQKLAAVETYAKLLEAYEAKYPLSSVRYRAGQILFDEGDLHGAEKLWSGLNNESGALYKRLASEKLSQAEWHDTYKKYIDRIPAAQDLK